MTPDRASAEERRLRSLVARHDRWRGREVFNLLASENAVSRTARRYLSSDLAGRYTLPVALPGQGETVDNGYTGTRYTDAIETLANGAAARLFHGRYATTRPLSGHIAALAALVPLVPRGGRIVAIPPEHGGYDGYAPGYLPAMLGYTVRPLPASGPGYTVRAEEAAATIAVERPDAVVLGQSFVLFPYPLRAIADAAHEVGALVLYDASHVFGLIAGGEFQDPLREGADVVYGSTHKSLPGPQGGLLVTDLEDLFRQIDGSLLWRVLDNAHWHRIAALGQTLLELERVGPDYARTVVANSRALGAALAEDGVPLRAGPAGYSASHQLLIDGEAMHARYGLRPGPLARRLERERLLIDLVGRIGTAEVSRLGLTPKEMPRLASLLVRGGLRGERVGPEVRRWRSEYRGLRFA